MCLVSSILTTYLYGFRANPSLYIQIPPFTKNCFIDEKITTVQGVILYVQKEKRQFFWLIHTSKSPEKLWKPKDHLSYMLGYCCNYVIIFRHFLVVLARMPKFWVFGVSHPFFLLIPTYNIYFHWYNAFVCLKVSLFWPNFFFKWKKYEIWKLVQPDRFFHTLSIRHNFFEFFFKNFFKY